MPVDLELDVYVRAVAGITGLTAWWRRFLAGLHVPPGPDPGAAEDGRTGYRERDRRSVAHVNQPAGDYG
jgi:hypothetical protein